MESGRSHPIYANTCDLHAENIKNKPRARAVKTPRCRVVVVLTILLVFMFLILLLLTSLVLHYKSIAERESHVKSNDSSNAMCGIDWTCRDLSCYYFSFRIKSWMMAKNDCEAMGAYLVVINNKEEMDFVDTFSYGMLVWIGLSRVNGTWKWEDGTSYASTEKFWHFGQPDNWSGHENKEEENCGSIVPVRRWNDDRCSRNIPYICEKKIS